MNHEIRLFTDLNSISSDDSNRSANVVLFLRKEKTKIKFKFDRSLFMK